ncbi:MAG TPA: (5-formylfuran-3-yl)methyl phosphate synthase [Planctomycetaceae bacterium]|nr:(5-formylfuran-3-yl)methyl phosphate synthase [Planctomycetaceae bacterium]
MSIRLLVSVRNVSEARSALEGGCDVLDVKDPGRGAMGMADVATIDAVREIARRFDRNLPVSAALGEAADWRDNASLPSLPATLSFLKLGTAGLGSRADWIKRFEAAKRAFENTHAASRNGRGASDGDASPASSGWIAVAYADCEAAAGPCPEAIIEKAAELGCIGVLIDTFSKANGRLIDWLSIERLHRLANEARSRNLTFALAGKLQIGDLAALWGIRPDIVGIRSAACVAGDRTGEINPVALRAFRDALLSGRPSHGESRAGLPATFYAADIERRGKNG